MEKFKIEEGYYGEIKQKYIVKVLKKEKVGSKIITFVKRTKYFDNIEDAKRWAEEREVSFLI